MERTSPPAAIAPATSRAGRRPVAVLVLGIVALVAGFAVVTLLCAVVAITLASLELQDQSEGRGDPGRRGMAVAGMVCAICALCIWIPVVLAVGIAQA
jgi:uncharacterized membrane-anchored protein